jgi:pentatricopeptide repeat protein
MTKFNSGRFAEAEKVFEQLMKSSDIGMADAARQRKRMCERRIAI